MICPKDLGFDISSPYQLRFVTVDPTKPVRYSDLQLECCLIRLLGHDDQLRSAGELRQSLWQDSDCRKHVFGSLDSLINVS